ncbi:hypothetical protein F2P79_009841 [Pimephales promelas]|nr:hypothetical protein F2P79_009841 [Pimephales promelas]
MLCSLRSIETRLHQSSLTDVLEQTINLKENLKSSPISYLHPSMTVQDVQNTGLKHIFPMDNNPQDGLQITVQQILA